jgi:hypothetical protein
LQFTLTFHGSGLKSGFKVAFIGGTRLKAYQLLALLVKTNWIAVSNKGKFLQLKKWDCDQVCIKLLKDIGYTPYF